MPRQRRVHFRSIGHIVTELGRQYRRADAGELDWNDARSAAAILREIRQSMEGGDIETRIAALEEAVASSRDGRPRARRRLNGHDPARARA